MSDESRVNDFLSGFDAAEQEALRAAASTHAVDEGHVFLRTGDANTSLYYIVSGSITVDRKVDDDEVWLATLNPGETFGEMSLLDGSPATANLTASESTEVLEFSGTALEQLFDDNPRLAARLWKVLAAELKRRLAETNELLAGYVDEKKLLQSGEFRRLSGHL